jgi:hypothetical protein
MLDKQTRTNNRMAVIFGGKQMRSVVDHMALRTNQFFIILFIVAGFLLDWPALVMFVAAVMAIGTIVPQAALFQQFYRQVLRPAGLLKPDVRQEDPAPHRFAQGVGAAFLIAATVAFVVGLPGVGWVLSGIVVVLAGVNLFFGFCAGCFVFFQLARVGLIRSTAQ